MAIFPDKPGLAGFNGAKDDGSGDDKWSRKTCKAPVKYPTFYRLDVLPVAQLTASKH